MELAIYLFRHGHVTDKNIFCGWLDLPLSKKGIKEAQTLAKKLSKEKIDVGFCSDQIRGKQCLAEVLKYHKKAKVIVDVRICERNYGELTGHKKEEFKSKFPKEYEEIHRGYNANIPSGENFSDVSKRVFSFMNDLFEFMQKEKCNVAISAHTNSLRLIQEYMENLSKEEATKLEHKPENYKKYVINFE